MQRGSWNDLRYLLALKRGRTLAAAARQLRVDDTTVSRRLAALQRAFRARLFERHVDGTLALTAIGDAIASRAEGMEREFDQIEQSLEPDRHACAGTVRLTSVPIVVNRVLVPAVKDLLHSHPRLRVELIPEGRNLSLTRREADLAVRIGRPKNGGSGVKARRIGTLQFCAYMPAGCSARDPARLPWITYDEAMAHLPQAQWIARATRQRPESVCALRVHDAETAMAAAVAGLGKTLLPRLVGDGDQRLQRMELRPQQQGPAREIWLLAHAHAIASRPIKTTIAWVEKVLSAFAPR